LETEGGFGGEKLENCLQETLGLVGQHGNTRWTLWGGLEKQKHKKKRQPERKGELLKTRICGNITPQI